MDKIHNFISPAMGIVNSVHANNNFIRVVSSHMKIINNIANLMMSVQTKNLSLLKQIAKNICYTPGPSMSVLIKEKLSDNLEEHDGIEKLNKLIKDEEESTNILKKQKINTVNNSNLSSNSEIDFTRKIQKDSCKSLQYISHCLDDKENWGQKIYSYIIEQKEKHPLVAKVIIYFFLYILPSIIASKFSSTPTNNITNINNTFIIKKDN